MNKKAFHIILSFSALAFVLLVSDGNGFCFGQFEHQVEDTAIENAARQAVSFLEDQGHLDGDKDLLRALVINAVSRRFDDCTAHEHPLVIQAIENITDNIEAGLDSGSESIQLSPIDPTLAFVVLCDVDSVELRTATVEEYLRSFRPFTNDSSEENWLHTYYAALSLPIAKRHGFLPRRQIIRNDLVRNMNIVDDSQWPVNKQNSSDHEYGGVFSRRCLLLSQIYLAADKLRLYPAPDGREGLGPEVPSAVSRYFRPVEPLVDDVSIPRIEELKRRGSEWISSEFPEAQRSDAFTWLNAIESYAYHRNTADGSFAELPDWYDRGVEVLLNVQDNDGSFSVNDHAADPVLDTCLATLFLVKVTETISDCGPHSSRITRLGSVQVFRTRGTREELLDVLYLTERENNSNPVHDLVRRMESYGASDYAMQSLFSRLVRERGYYQRLAAVELLAADPDMERVPFLLYALGDPDSTIGGVAHNGLRLVSRKIDTISLPVNATREDFERVRRQWTDWYLGLRPDAKLIEE
ncbi:MAG: hypothetical protein AAF456_01655 [Planctomycetota bacterium]